MCGVQRTIWQFHLLRASPGVEACSRQSIPSGAAWLVPHDNTSPMTQSLSSKASRSIKTVVVMACVIAGASASPPQMAEMPMTNNSSPDDMTIMVSPGLAPLNVMTGRAGHWMFSYQFMLDRMDGNLSGTTDVLFTTIVSRVRLPYALRIWASGWASGRMPRANYSSLFFFGCLTCPPLASTSRFTITSPFTEVLCPVTVKVRCVPDEL